MFLQIDTRPLAETKNCLSPFDGGVLQNPLARRPPHDTFEFHSAWTTRTSVSVKLLGSTNFLPKSPCFYPPLAANVSASCEPS